MASCWLCLDDEADECGKPPVRDCSCRGDDAGFAHVSCIVDYARRKSSEADYWAELADPWIRCEHCKQFYQNQLRIYLLDEWKRFVEEQYPGCNWRHLVVQNQLLMAVREGAERSIEKREEIIDTTLSIVDQLSTHPDPLSSANIALLKATALNSICLIRLGQEDLTEDEAKKCQGFLEEARWASESFGDALCEVELEITVERFKARCIKTFGAQREFGELESLELRIERRRFAYQLMSENRNLSEVSVLKAGLGLAVLLSNANRTIEAWRLKKRLITISRQYHGREHSNTKFLEQKLTNPKIYFVTLPNIVILWKAIGYEEDKYVLQGPIEFGVPEGRMQTLRVDPADVVLQSFGTPIVCHGLKNKAAYLNGKIGEIRSIDNTTRTYGVYFEDESIKPKSMKRRNLRILFELPDN